MGRPAAVCTVTLRDPCLAGGVSADILQRSDVCGEDIENPAAPGLLTLCKDVSEVIKPQTQISSLWCNLAWSAAATQLDLPV